ncbi:4'-phosphopantetheinyl transferase superfamily protein [Glaciimonas sp. PCH181]|uniref:4'-phosphopantetheinyl transferase family protein n=1 Tax=Glaciimonas sp. PCH181 TaxID=2133943 RepID=UPI001374CF1F|nr:4'-phosphopantetheinyl transferase superfamily protein [Glaciimonas sp. PCH181]
MFASNAYGRPEIANPDVASKIAFNISHTKNLIVLGITFGDTLGVDVENVGLRDAPLDLASQFFSPNEVAALVALPPESQSQRFFQYWTLKEAYVKARGMGLSIPLDQFEFDFTTDRHIKFSTNPSLNDSPSRWQFWQFQPSEDHLLAVCAERFDGPKPEFLMRKIVPLEAEQFINCPMLCASA